MNTVSVKANFFSKFSGEGEEAGYQSNRLVGGTCKAMAAILRYSIVALLGLISLALKYRLSFQESNIRLNQSFALHSKIKELSK